MMRFKNLVSSKLLSIVTCLDVDFNCHSRIGLTSWTGRDRL